MAVIVLDGMRRMYYEEEDIFYYITLMNENYDMPILPLGSTEGICRGIYKLSDPRPGLEARRRRSQLFGSGAILREVAPRPGAPGGAVRRRQQRLQRDQLQEPVLRRPRLRALEPPASAGRAAPAVRSQQVLDGQRARSWRRWITSAPWRFRSLPG